MGGENVPGERSSDPGDLLPLTPVALNVLLALADGERHGYGIMLEVRERTFGRVRLGPGTLYGAIKRLKEGGVIEASGERPNPGEAPDDERRRYYRLTGFGGEVLAAEVERLDGLVRAARRTGASPPPRATPRGAAPPAARAAGARSGRRRSKGWTAWCAPRAGRAPSLPRSRARRGPDGLSGGTAPAGARTRGGELGAGLPVAPAGIPARASRRVRRRDGPPFSGPVPRGAGGRRRRGAGGRCGA